MPYGLRGVWIFRERRRDASRECVSSVESMRLWSFRMYEKQIGAHALPKATVIVVQLMCRVVDRCFIHKTGRELQIM